MNRAAARKCRSGNALELEFRRQLKATLGPEIVFEVADLPGTPDAVHALSRTAVFLHGCFWHGCSAHYKEPGRNRRYWRAKIRKNRRRDAQAQIALEALGWRVLVLWEHEMREFGAERVIAEIRRGVRALWDCRSRGT